MFYSYDTTIGVECAWCKSNLLGVELLLCLCLWAGHSAFFTSHQSGPSQLWFSLCCCSGFSHFISRLLSCSASPHLSLRGLRPVCETAAVILHFWPLHNEALSQRQNRKETSCGDGQFIIAHHNRLI